MNAKRLVIFFIIILLLSILSIIYPKLTGESVNSSDTGYQKEPAIVTRIVDGDTIHVNLNGKDETIRLLGINTPEKNMAYSKEAVDFLKKTIENEEVDTLRDKEDVDKYNRKLRYVFYNDRFLNLEILEQGLATSFMLEGLRYEKELTNAENSAKINKIGLWKQSTELCASCIKLLELNAENEYFIIENSCNFYCNLTGWFVKDEANHFFKLDNLNNQESKRYSSDKEIWNDDGDRFFMRDNKGDLAVFYEY